MGISSNVVYQSGVAEDSVASRFGMSFAFGGAAEVLGFGRGTQYISRSTGGVLGGGWQNRFVVGAKESLLSLAGIAKTETPFARLNARRSHSFFGWRNVQAETIMAAKALPVGAERSAMLRGSKTFFRVLKSSPKKLLGRGALGLVGAAVVIPGIYSKFKNEGFLAGVKEAAIEGGSWAMMGVGEAALATLGGSAALGAAYTVGAVATVGYAGYKALEYGRDVGRGIRNLEMVSPISDPHGLGYTMRQRSVTAIQRSYLNGRCAVGNEAMLMAPRHLR